MKNIFCLMLILSTTTTVLVNAQGNTFKPEDDFYSWVNQDWLNSSQNKSGTLKSIQEKTDQQLLSVLKKNVLIPKLPINSAEKKLIDFYKSGLDTIKLEKRGYEPLLKYFTRIDKVQNFNDFFNLVATFHNEGQEHFLGIDIGQDDKNSNYNALLLTQKGLTLGIPSVYVAEGEIFNQIRTRYKKYLQTIFELTGQSKDKSEKIAQEIFDFEKEMATSFTPESDLYNPDLTYNKMSVGELEKLTPNIKWSSLFKVMELKTSFAIVQTPKYFVGLNSLVDKKDLEIWKNKLKAYIILKRTNALSFPFRDALVELKSVFTGNRTHNPRADILLEICNNEILGKLYVNDFFSKQSKDKVETIALNIKYAFRQRLINNQWMTEETKSRALKKLNALEIKIGYPKEIDDYSDVTINENMFFENMDSWSVHNFKSKIENLNKITDRSRWLEALPQTVNAYYDPLNNALIFPAAILQEPLFSKDYNEARLYGSIGYIIGHELTHGFDKNGKKYNANGSIEMWWNNTDEQSFEVLCTNLKNQFSRYKISDSLFVNGELTLSENIADLGGINVAYDAYKMTLTGKKNDRKADKEFFISFAKVWREKLTPQELENVVLRDTHAPPKWRVNGVLSNFTPFYKTFEIDEQNAFYKEEKDRIVIW
jgi:putative endopeptidase